MFKKLLKDVQVGDIVYFSNEQYQGIRFKPCTVTCKTEQRLTLQHNGMIVFDFIGTSNEIYLVGEYEEINRKGARIIFSKTRVKEIQSEMYEYIDELRSDVEYLHELLDSSPATIYLLNYNSRCKSIIKDLLNIMINKYGEATINSVFIEDIIEVLEIYYIVKHIHREDLVNLVRYNSFEDVMKLYKEMK